jgi:hypothetical protein
MGPISSEWIRVNGDCWAGGRIDIWNDKGEVFETSLPLMHVDGYHRFASWLRGYVSVRKQSFDKLRRTYEFNNPKLRLWKEERNE